MIRPLLQQMATSVGVLAVSPLQLWTRPPHQSRSTKNEMANISIRIIKSKKFWYTRCWVRSSVESNLTVACVTNRIKRLPGFQWPHLVYRGNKPANRWQRRERREHEVTFIIFDSNGYNHGLKSRYRYWSIVFSINISNIGCQYW